METAKTYVEENQMDDFLRIPLQWAALKGHAEIVELFMDNLRDNEWQKIPVLSFETDENFFCLTAQFQWNSSNRGSYTKPYFLMPFKEEVWM